ncbi:hypothetical protein Mgra_00003589 [Meloidogyne graminicola]|uniref:Uncharacterized protein n=1 Tax=Meloidogyne graminicola TaxID=189291 RepID=A0A8S9ZUT8_9BILA|nr:hypothetical protein Mgra_00003589 [Meloidogyne graminicola]
MRSLFLLILISLIEISAKNHPGSKLKYCGKRYEQWIDKVVCKWPGEYDPCFQLHFNAKERVKNKCCQVGCNIEETKEVCCFTQTCLNRCYPGKNYIAGSYYTYCIRLKLIKENSKKNYFRKVKLEKKRKEI